MAFVFEEALVTLKALNPGQRYLSETPDAPAHGALVTVYWVVAFEYSASAVTTERAFGCVAQSCDSDAAFAC